MKKTKTKKRNYFSIAICEAGDIDGWYVSVMDVDTQKAYQGTVYKTVNSANELQMKLMIGGYVLKLMGFKL